KLIFILIGCLLLLIPLLIFSVHNFMVGFHNLDLGQNINFLNAKYNLNLLDRTEEGELLTGTELYVYGSIDLRKNFFLFGFLSFGLGYCIGFLIFLLTIILPNKFIKNKNKGN
ncbi:MAG: hypothetical protein QXU39_02500, partial [Candidatus Pacearchaeota archaeon]